MARKAVLARMETIFVEVMEMPEIFLADDEEDDDGPSEDLDADESDDDASDDIPAADGDCDSEEGTGKDESTGKSDGKSSDKADVDRKKGVSVKVNCDDKKQQRYGKWISRALRIAVNPIVSRFNLNLKVNLDLNVANKTNANKKNDPKDNSNAPTKPDNKPKPTLHQQQRRADLSRIKELEQENRYLAKVFEKIGSAYKAMKTKHSEQSMELEMYKNRALDEEAKVQQLTEERNKLKEQSELQTSINKQLEKNNLILQKQISETQRKLDTLNKQYEDKSMKSKELEAELRQSLEHNKNSIATEKKCYSDMLSEKQAIIDSREEQLQQLKSELQSLQDQKTSSESEFQQRIQQNQQKNSQLELKMVELLRQNRQLNDLVSRGLPLVENSTVMEPTSHTTGYGYTCPLCGHPFKTSETFRFIRRTAARENGDLQFLFKIN